VRLPIVVDTNVVVSGILTSDPNAPTARIVDAMLGLDNSEIDIVLTTLADNAVVRKPIDPPSLPPDRGDRHLWALLAAHPGTTLITGDRALLEHPPDWAKVVAPGDFVHFV